MSLVNVVYFTGRGLCDGQILRPEESYRVCDCGIECNQVQQYLSTPAVSGYD